MITKAALMTSFDNVHAPCVFVYILPYRYMHTQFLTRYNLKFEVRTINMAYTRAGFKYQSINPDHNVY